MRSALFASLSLSAACHAVPATEPVTAQRPFFSTDTGTPPSGSFEIEAGVVAEIDETLLLPTTLKYGAGERTELFLGWAPFQHVELEGPDSHGTGDVTLGAKHRLVDLAADHPGLAVQGSVKLPTGVREEGLGTGELDLLLGAAATQLFDGWSVSAYYQLDTFGEPGAGGPDVGHAVALAAASPLHERCSLFGEVVQAWVPEQDFAPAFTTLGVAWNPCRLLVLDLACVVALNDDVPGFQLAFGITENLGRLAE
ncbi:MAG: transporter [Planctomycetes bacterium]|nr:transporter [Planctomycetota bacterium]